MTWDVHMIRRWLLRLAGGLFALWLLVPTKDVVCPDWDVLVTDTQGTAIAGASVDADSQQYTLEQHGTSVSRMTDKNGRVHFNGRRVRANGFMRVLGVVKGLDQGAHASFGVHTWLFASKPGFGEPAELSLFGQNEREGRANGKAYQSSHLVLQRCAEGYGGIGCSFPDDMTKPVLPLHQNDSAY